MGGAEATAPPIFYSGDTIANLPFNLLAYTVTHLLQVNRSGEDFREKTLPYRAFVRHRLARHSACDSLRSERFCTEGFRCNFTGQKEK